VSKSTSSARGFLLHGEDGSIVSLARETAESGAGKFVSDWRTNYCGHCGKLYLVIRDTSRNV